MSNKYKHGKYRISIAGDKNIQNKVVSITDDEGNDALGGGGGGGTSDYTDLENKPSINGVELSGNKKSNELGVYSKPSGGIPESDLSPDVRQALQKHFKGWYTSTASLPANPVVGDYAYVKGATTSDPVAIYECTTDGLWSDSGHTFNPANNQEFASGEELNTVRIVDSLDSNVATDVLSAKQGVVLKEQGDVITLYGNNNTIYSDYVKCLSNHTYRIYPSKTTIDVSGVTYAINAYDFFSITLRDNVGTLVEVLERIGCDKKTAPLEKFYDVTTKSNGLLRIGIRCSSGESLYFKVVDVTDNYDIPRKTVVGYIKNDNTVVLSGVNNRVSWFVVPAMSKVHVKSICSDVILAQCSTIGQDTNLVPLFKGDGSNTIEFVKYFKEETIVALTYMVNTDWHFNVSRIVYPFMPVYNGKSLLDIFEGESEISGCRLMDNDTPFTKTQYFYNQLTNYLTNGRCIGIVSNSNSYLEIDVDSGHIYALIESIRCDKFTPSSSLSYFDKGGSVIGLMNPLLLSSENLLRFGTESLSDNSISYAPVIADKKYRTLIQFATATDSGKQCITFGTRNAANGDAILGSFCLDNVFIVDLTDLFGGTIPTYEEFVAMFGEYLRLYTNENFINDGYADKQMKMAFIDAINRNAAHLGMNDSHFDNPGGTDSTENYFTADDALKMLCAFAKTSSMYLSSIPTYDTPVDRGGSIVDISTEATYKGSTQVSKLEPYIIIAGKTGTLNADSHQDVGGYNMNTANVGLIVKSPIDGALLAGVVILPLTKQGGYWKTQNGYGSPYNDRYDVLKDLFDLLENQRAGGTVTQEEINALGCGYAAACVVPQFYCYNEGSIATISKNGTSKCWPASMTKMMTLLTLVDYFDYNETLQVYGTDIMGGSGITLQGNDKLKGSDAIIAMMLPSTNTLAAMFSRIYGLKYLQAK